MLTEEQRNELFDIIINDNDFVLFALFQIENRNAQNLHTEYTLMKEAFDNFENNMMSNTKKCNCSIIIFDKFRICWK